MGQFYPEQSDDGKGSNGEVTRREVNCSDAGDGYGGSHALEVWCRQRIAYATNQHGNVRALSPTIRTKLV